MSTGADGRADGLADGGTDGRSVGELLLDCEFIARDVLIDAPHLDAAAMLRTWGEVVQAAGELWAALPAPPHPAGTAAAAAGGTPREEGAMMGRLAEMTAALHRSIRGQTWPGPGPGDPRLSAMADNLTRAAELVTAASPQRPTRVAARQDLAAARARLMHTLYVGVHGVTLAVGHHTRDLEGHYERKGWIPPTQSLQVARAAQHRLAAFEQLTGSYVARTYPRDLEGEHALAPVPDRLAQALATWDITAHRALTDQPTAANLMLIAQTQAMTIAASRALLNAAADTGHISAENYRTLLAPALDVAAGGWAATARTWAELTPPSQRRPTPDLSMAAAETRAALREITHDRTGPARPEVIAARTHLTRATATIGQALASSVEIAYAMNDTLRSPHLQGAARAVNALNRTTDTTTAAASLHAGEELGCGAAFVNPRDLPGNRPTAIPERVLDLCAADLERTIEAAKSAMNAGAVLDHTPRQDNQPGTQSLGRHHQHRTAPTTSLVDRPGPGCAR